LYVYVPYTDVLPTAHFIESQAHESYMYTSTIGNNNIKAIQKRACRRFSQQYLRFLGTRID